MNKEDRPNIDMHSRYTSELTPRNERQFFAPENGDPLHAAFDKKTVVHPEGRSRPVSPERRGEIWTKCIGKTQRFRK